MKKLLPLFLTCILLISCNNNKDVEITIHLSEDSVEAIKDILANDTNRSVNINLYCNIETPIVPAEVKKEEKPETPKVEDKKEIIYENHYTLTNNKLKNKDLETILNLNESEYNDLFNSAVSDPETYDKILPYLITRKLLDSNEESEMIDLNISSPNYNFYLDPKSKNIVKKKTNNMALFENVETPKPTDKEETK